MHVSSGGPAAGSAHQLLGGCFDRPLGHLRGVKYASRRRRAVDGGDGGSGRWTAATAAAAGKRRATGAGRRMAGSAARETGAGRCSHTAHPADSDTPEQFHELQRDKLSSAAGPGGWMPAGGAGRAPAAAGTGAERGMRWEGGPGTEQGA